MSHSSPSHPVPATQPLPVPVDNGKRPVPVGVWARAGAAGALDGVAVVTVLAALAVLPGRVVLAVLRTDKQHS